MRTRSTFPTLVLLVTASLLGACGGGGDDDGVASLTGAGSDSEDSATSTTLSEEEAQEKLLDWAECMRDHGVDMPDPQIGEDGGVQIQVGGPAGGGDEGETDGDAPQRPSAEDRDAFEAANEACGEPPMLGTFTEEDREQMEEDALEFSECMRDEGIEDFPDPDFSNFGPGRGPATNEATADDEDDDEGGGARVFGPWGEIDLEDPETAAAFEACQDQLGGPDGGGPTARVPVGASADANDS